VKLNGWHRIGILGSIVWIFGAGMHTFIVEQDQNNRNYVSLMESCIASYTSNSDQRINADDFCTKTWANFNVSALHEERVEALTVALLPVPVAWGLAYLVLFLIRWVKRGGFQAKL
jgi:hypothetical protein